MPDAYQVHDAQFLQNAYNISAADALVVALGPVPAGKVWTLLNVLGYCSAAETQIYWAAITSIDGNFYPITRPASFAIAPAVQQWWTALLEGMEIKIYPRESIQVRRAAATAGSTIACYIRYIETDLDFYVELDKHKTLQRRSEAMAEARPGFLRRSGAGSRASMAAGLIRDRTTREG